jgi:hypothetical protein
MRPKITRIERAGMPKMSDPFLLQIMGGMMGLMLARMMRRHQPILVDHAHTQEAQDEWNQATHHPTTTTKKKPLKDQEKEKASL